MTGNRFRHLEISFQPNEKEIRPLATGIAHDGKPVQAAAISIGLDRIGFASSWKTFPFDGKTVAVRRAEILPAGMRILAMRMSILVMRRPIPVMRTSIAAGRIEIGEGRKKVPVRRAGVPVGGAQLGANPASTAL
jgi:hypothetical protein